MARPTKPKGGTMKRTRHIKPGILDNEDLHELGPYAYILFTGLWMLADREGRLEDRPRRIWMESMALWPEVDAGAVDNLLEKLSKKEFIHRYEVRGQRYIAIPKWHFHQIPHPRESASIIPPPPDLKDVSVREFNNLNGDMPRPDQGTAKDCPSPSRTRTRTRTRVGGVKATGIGAVQNALFDPPPPPRKTETINKQPERETRSEGGPREAPPKARPPDVEVMRESLMLLAEAARLSLPPPDDEIIRRVLEAGNGHSASEIHELLCGLFKLGKFRGMRSWGLLPMLVAQWCRAA